MSAAIVVWLLTMIAVFVSSLGNVVTTLQISAGSVWIWIVRHFLAGTK